MSALRKIQEAWRSRPRCLCSGWPHSSFCPRSRPAGRWSAAGTRRTRGTPEQVAAYRQAHVDLFRNGRYEEKAAIREETPRFLDLNERACHACAPLSPFQQWWHWQRALVTEDRDFGRLQQAADQQERSRRRSR